MKQVNTVDSADVLAKVLAVENLTVVHSAKAATATFDTETRTLTLPCFVQNIKAETRNMFVGHEVGHALFSPGAAGEKNSREIIKKAINEIDANNESIVMGYLNIVEDARIERMFKVRYPGLIPDFKTGYRELLDRDFFKIRHTDINSLPLIDRINLFFKCMNAPEIANMKFSPEESNFLNKIQNTKTWSDVVSVTKEIYEYSGSESQNQNDMGFSEESESEDGENEEEGTNGNSKNSSKKGKKNSKSSKSSENDEEGTDDTESNSNGNDSEDKESKSGSGSGNDGEGNTTQSSNSLEGGKKNVPTKRGTSAPKSITDEAFSQNVKNLVDKKAKDTLYLKIPNINLKDFVVDYKTVQSEYRIIRKNNKVSFQVVKNHFSEFKKDNSNKINYLFIEFNRKKKAEEHQKDKTDKTGTIDCSRLVHYKYSEDIFKSNTIKYIGKNHSLTALIDFSGSMTSNILETVEQALCMALFAKKAGIPFELYTFGHSSINRNSIKYSDREIVLPEGFILRQFFSANMTPAEYNEACENLLAATDTFSNVASSKDGLGSYTPLSQSLITAIFITEKMAKEHKTTYNHVMLLTDGAGSTLTQYQHNNYITTVDFHNYNVLVHDPVTKKNFDYNMAYGKNDRVYAEILRYRTGCNLIGFYCTGSGKEQTINAAAGYTTNKSRAELSEEFNTNNFITCVEKGYTEYYVIPGGKTLGIKKVSASDLSEYSKHIKKDRILLNRFIHLLTEKGKMV